MENKDDLEADWAWKLCNMLFGNIVAPEDWKINVVSLYKSKGMKTQCNDYIDINLPIMVVKSSGFY